MQRLRSGKTSRVTGSQARRHVIKACEGCRQQKIRCNGESPCERCTRLSLPCIVRRAHSRLSHISFGPVRIRNVVSGWTAVYGPTSTVALLQLIVSSKSANYTLSISDTGMVIDSNQSDDLLNYHLFVVENCIPSPTLGAFLTPPRCLTTIPQELLEFLLERYVKTAWASLPMQSPAYLSSVLISSCSAINQISQPPLLYPLLLYQLAMGSLSTVQGELAEMLTQEAELVVDSTGGHLSRELEIQLNILMIIFYIQYQCEIGHFNRAYLRVGQIASRAFAAGLQYEPRTPEVNRLLQELVASENHVCIALGRQPFLRPTLQISHTNEPPDMKFVHGLFDTINTWLNSFWQEHEPILGFAHVDPYTAGGVDETMLLNTILYHYTILTNFKPLLLYLGYKNILGKGDAPPPLQTDGPARLDNAHEDSRLSSVSDYIFNSAKIIVSTFSKIFDRGSLAKDLPMNSFFLEAACISLLSLTSRGLCNEDLPDVWEFIDSATHCMEKMKYQKVGAMRLAVVKAAIEREVSTESVI
ncbi:hypothetical protein BDW69DRAFT_203798 [Aspergillus filifer]